MEPREYYQPLSSMIVDFIESDDHEFEVRMHYHDGYEILFFEQATARFLVDVTLCDIRDGDVLFIRPYTMHTAYRLSGGHYRRYYINAAWGIVDQWARHLGLEDIVETLNEQPFTLLSAGRDDGMLGRVRARFGSVWGHSRQQGSHWQSILQTELILLLADIREGSAARPSTREPDRENPHIRQMLSYIDGNILNGVTLHSLEEAFFLSRHYICRLFRRHTGLTVSQYINRKKVILAQQILLDPGATVTEACYASGFLHLQYFSKIFKRITGMTPSQYQKTVAERDPGKILPGRNRLSDADPTTKSSEREENHAVQ